MGEQETHILKSYSLKQTAGRIALLKVMLASDRPISHKEICAKLDGFNYDAVSIYRSLESFIKAGFVHKVEDDRGAWLYALCTCNKMGHCHPHFFCRHCGLCKCLDEYKMPALEQVKDDFIVEEQRYYLKGICSDCKK